jgi:hypothetical protein
VRRAAPHPSLLDDAGKRLDGLQAHDALDFAGEDLAWIEGTVTFYDSFYRAQTKQRTGKELGDDGKYVFYPTCCGLEFAGNATDAIEVVAALRPSRPACSRCRSFPPPIAGAPAGRCWPPCPNCRRACGRVGRRCCRRVRWERDYNKWEPIEMYAAWPYRLVGITQPDTLQLARDTWETVPADRARLCKQDYSWMANVANMAALAWPEKAKERAIYKLANTAAPQARFPAFFGPGHDWLPDHNWGGSGHDRPAGDAARARAGCKAASCTCSPLAGGLGCGLQAARAGPDRGGGQLKGGKLVSLRVTPASREKDIVNWLGKQPEWAVFVPPVSLGQGKAITASSQFDQPGYDARLANDGDPSTRWASDFAARSGWLEMDLGVETEIGRVVVSEIEWPETREFVIEVKQGDAWQEVARGTTIGAEKEITFAPLKTRLIRLNVLRSERPVNINEFQVFAP